MSKRMILTIATVLCVIMTCVPLISFISSPCSDGSTDATFHSGDSESFTDNDIVYEISGEDTVTVTGNIARYGVFTADVPATIDYDGTTYTVTAVIGFIQINTLNLPSTVSVVSLSDLTSNGELGSTGMENINVDENNPVYASVNGVLYSKDMSRLVYFPMFNKGDGDGKFTIPSSIATINDDAFQLFVNITKFSAEGNTSYKTDSRGFLYTADGKKIVRACGSYTTQADPYTIPEGVTEICDYAFCGTSMKKISISRDDNGKCSLTKIGYAAFRQSSIEQLKYEDEPDNNAVKSRIL